MPFNGTGTFVRLFNWTNDANNSIPISATRFDGEDNDFASGLSLCLTRDSQGTPTAPLTWAQPLTINVGSDETVIAAGRTGGVNNPQLQIKVADATGATINLSTAQQLALAIAGTNYLLLSGTGALSVNAPSSNRALAITTAGYTFGNATDNPTYTFAGSGAFTIAGSFTVGGVNVNGSTIPGTGIYAPSANSLGFCANGVAAGAISSAGAWSIPAPINVVGLTLNGGANTANTFLAKLLAGTAAGFSSGLLVQAGTNTSDTAFQVINASASTIYAAVYGDGEAVIVQPPAATLTGTGGTLWQAGYLETPQNSQSASYQLVITDRGKHIYQTGGTVITIPANSSVPFPIGTTTVLVNHTGGTLSIAITTDSLIWSPSGTTGTRTFASNGIATLLKITATAWLISGTGLS